MPSQGPYYSLVPRSLLDDVLATIAEVNPKITNLDANADLREAGIDSLCTVALVVALEARFRITFSSETLTEENFQTPACIAATIKHLSEV